MLGGAMNKIDPSLPGADKHAADHSNRQRAIFRDAGFSAKAADAIVGIDGIMQRIRRSMMKREFVGEMLKGLDPNIDMLQLDVMSVIANWHPEPGGVTDPEVTVGTVAEKLKIDPSRASRLVAEIVDHGYARRVASQADARRICLEVTEKGRAFGDAFRRRKSEMLSLGLQGWTEEELLTFERLLERYSNWGPKGMEAGRAAHQRAADMAGQKSPLARKDRVL
jgi:DNA-binding MarR family transcriptional regulator